MVFRQLITFLSFMCIFLQVSGNSQSFWCISHLLPVTVPAELEIKLTWPKITLPVCNTSVNYIFWILVWYLL